MVTRYAAEIATACATAALGLAVIVGALEFGIGWGSAGPEPGAFPFYMGLMIVGASLATTIQTVAHRHRIHERFLDGVQAARVASFFVPLTLFLICAVLLGLYVATALYLFGVMWRQGGYRPVVAAPLAVGVAILFFVVLELAFKVPLLKGPLEAALGL
jgi:hypothetical protein